MTSARQTMSAFAAQANPATGYRFGLQQSLAACCEVYPQAAELFREWGIAIDRLGDVTGAQLAEHLGLDAKDLLRLLAEELAPPPRSWSRFTEDVETIVARLHAEHRLIEAEFARLHVLHDALEGGDRQLWRTLRHLALITEHHHTDEEAECFPAILGGEVFDQLLERWARMEHAHDVVRIQAERLPAVHAIDRHGYDTDFDRLLAVGIRGLLDLLAAHAREEDRLLNKIISEHRKGPRSWCASEESDGADGPSPP